MLRSSVYSWVLLGIQLCPAVLAGFVSYVLTWRLGSSCLLEKFGSTSGASSKIPYLIVLQKVENKIIVFLRTKIKTKHTRTVCTSAQTRHMPLHQLKPYAKIKIIFETLNRLEYIFHYVHC